MGPLGHGPADPLVIRTPHGTSASFLFGRSGGWPPYLYPPSWPHFIPSLWLPRKQMFPLYSLCRLVQKLASPLVLAGFAGLGISGGDGFFGGEPETDRPSDVRGTGPASSHCGGPGVVSVAHIPLHASMPPGIKRGSPASVVAAVSTWSSKDSIVQAHRELMKAARPRALDPGEHMPSPPPLPAPTPAVRVFASFWMPWCHFSKLYVCIGVTHICPGSSV